MFKKAFSALLIILLIAPWEMAISSQDPKAAAADHYRLGTEYYKEGKFQQAENEFSQALALLEKEKLAPVPKEEKVLNKPAVTDATQLRKSSGKTEYIIGEDDALYISVWENQDLNQEVTVRPDGMISFPLIGDIQAAGLTIREFKDKIAQDLTEYVLEPDVSVSVRKLGGRKVMLLGEVSTEGVYSVTGQKTILEALALAGGLTRDSLPSSTILIRRAFSGNPKPRRINLSKALAGDLKENVTLESEDVIFIPKKFIADLNYFMNQLLEPLTNANTGYSTLHAIQVMRRKPKD